VTSTQGVGSAAPSVTSPGNQSSAEGNAVSLQVGASDPSGDPLTFSATGLPAGLSIDNSGLISGSIASGDAQVNNGNYSVTVTATDSQGEQGSTIFAWTVIDEPPSVAGPGNQANVEGDVISLPVSASDPGGNPVTFSAAGLPAGLAIDSTTGLIGGTIAYGDSQTNNGNYVVTVTATDSEGAEGSTMFNWMVIYNPPSVTSPDSQSSVEGDTVSLPVSASDPAGNPLTYSATGLPPGLSIDSTTGLISGTVAYGDAQADFGTYTVMVTVTDSQGAQDTASFPWFVSDEPPSVTSPGNQSNVEGDVVSLQVGASDPEGDPLTYDATGLPAGLAIDNTGGLIAGTIDAGDAQMNNGNYTVTVTATDSEGTEGSVTFPWTVTAAASSGNHPPSVSNPGNQSDGEGDNVSLQVAAGDPDGDPLTYGATGLPPGLSIDNTGLISGSIDYGDAQTNNGNYTVVVTVTDSQGAQASTSLAWTVTDDSPSVASPDNQMNVEGDAVSVQVSASDPDGDALTYTAGGLPAGLSMDSTTGLISGTIAYGDAETSNGSYTVVVTAACSEGTESSASFAWTVTDEPPSVTNPGGQSNAEGDSVSLQAGASDPDGDALTFSASGLPAGLSNDDTGLISGSIDAGDAQTNNGSYTVVVTATTSDGEAGSTSFPWTVTATGSSSSHGPWIINPGSQSNVEGNGVSLQVSAGDPVGHSLTFSATGLPAGLGINNHGLIAGTIDYGDAQTSDGNYSVTVTVTGWGDQASATFAWTVADEPPSIVNPGNQSNVAGGVVSLQVIGSDPDGDPLTYSADGLPAGLTIDPNSGTISGTVADPGGATQVFAAMVTASDGSVSSSQTFQWTVGRLGLVVPGEQHNGHGDAINLWVAGTGPAGTAFHFTATGLPTGLTMSGVGDISGTVSGTAMDTSPYSVTVTVSDGQGASASGSFRWYIHLVSITDPGTQTYYAWDDVKLSIAASDSQGAPVTYSATGLPGGLSIDPHTGQITGTVTEPQPYSALTTYMVTLLAMNPFGQQAQQPMDMQVKDFTVTLEKDWYNISYPDWIVLGINKAGYLPNPLITNVTLVVSDPAKTNEVDLSLSGAPGRADILYTSIGSAPGIIDLDMTWLDPEHTAG
jgi:hypothetical protein